MEERLFFEGLHALAASAFPKRCGYCGRVFATAREFMLETRSVRQHLTGLKQSFDDDSVAIVEAYRNCLCGSTLMDFFSDRRALSESGARRRELFEKLLPHLQEKGMTPAAGREHLLALLRGQEKSGNAGSQPA